MAVRISITTMDDIEDLSAVAIKDEICKTFGLKDAEVIVSKLTIRQYNKVTGVKDAK
jgi:hypothetical protein